MAASPASAAMWPMARALATMNALIVGRNAMPPVKPSLPPLASIDEIVYSVASSSGSIQYRPWRGS